jgi:hypothetical protein
MMRTVFAFIIITWVSVSAGQDEDKLRGILAGIRASLDYQTHSLILEGEGEASGLESRFRLYFTPNGRFRIDVDNDLKTIVGFDGETGWSIDYSGMPYPLQGWALEVEQLIAWFICGYWLDADSPLEFSLDDDGRILARLSSGIVGATIQSDSTTNLPMRLTWRIYDVDCSVLLEDFCEGIARRIVIQRDGEITDIKSIEVKTTSEISDDVFHPITSRPNDTVFSRENVDGMEVRRTEYGLCLVRPLVDGKDIGWFTVDTGAGRNVIATKYAEQLAMNIVGTSSAVGVGGRVQVNYRQCKSMQLGPLEITDPIYYEINFGESGVDNRGGILGYDFFRRCLVELDLEESLIAIHEPGYWDDLDEAWQEFVFHDNIPAVYCTLEGDIQGLFTIDTGSDTNVALHKKYVEDHNLLEGRDVQKVYLGGVGGAIPCFYGPLEWFQLAGHRFENPEVLFAGGDQGVFTDKVTAGIIGRGFLSAFKLLIDYPGQRIAFSEKD